jgi:hypothetical protein
MQFDNPTQDVMIDADRGAVKIESDSPGHKVMMRTPEQVGGCCRLLDHITSCHSRL